MNISCQLIEVYPNFLGKAFRVHALVEYYRELEVPIQISGVVKTEDSKIIAICQETEIQPQTDFFLVSHKKEIADKIYSNASQYKNLCRAQLTTILSQEAIEHIELKRQSDPEKSVHLHINFVVKYLVSQPGEVHPLNESVPLFRLTTNIYNCPFKINQDDWINKFARQLQVGDFILIKLELNTGVVVGEEWKVLHERLTARLKEMHECRIKANWKGVIEESRKFYEILKFSEKKPGSKLYINTLKELFKNDQHSEESFAEFQTGVFHLFQSISKYIHEKDLGDHLKSEIIPTKEDAEMIYLNAVGLYNLFVQKISKF